MKMSAQARTSLKACWRCLYGWIGRFDSSTMCYEFSKITTHLGKKLFQSSRTYAVKWQFWAENPTNRQAWWIRYSRTKHAVLFYWRNRTTAKTEYLMGSTVKKLLKLWVCKLSFLKRHPSIQKGKIMKQRALIAVIKEILLFLLPLGTPRLIDWLNTGRRILPNPRLSMESNWRPQLTAFKAMAPLTGPEKGVLFKGAYFPQKLTPKSSIETRYNSVQRHVLSY
jgi:hypothetical protein